MINNLDLAAVSHFGIDKKSPMEARRKAALLFTRALGRGTLRRFICRIIGKEYELKHLAKMDVSSKERSTQLNGMVIVRLEQIVGSENRSSDFDNRFYPLNSLNQLENCRCSPRG